jgi:hypothetical protein
MFYVYSFMEVNQGLGDFEVVPLLSEQIKG